MPGKNGQIAGSALVRDSRERREHCAAHPWLSRNHSICYRPRRSRVHLGNIR